VRRTLTPEPGANVAQLAFSHSPGHSRSRRFPSLRISPIASGLACSPLSVVGLCGRRLGGAVYAFCIYGSCRRARRVRDYDNTVSGLDANRRSASGWRRCTHTTVSASAHNLPRQWGESPLQRAGCRVFGLHGSKGLHARLDWQQDPHIARAIRDIDPGATIRSDSARTAMKCRE
jgi:hypothetical protein